MKLLSQLAVRNETISAEFDVDLSEIVSDIVVQLHMWSVVVQNYKIDSEWALYSAFLNENYLDARNYLFQLLSFVL